MKAKIWTQKSEQAISGGNLIWPWFINDSFRAGASNQLITDGKTMDQSWVSRSTNTVWIPTLTPLDNPEQVPMQQWGPKTRLQWCPLVEHWAASLALGKLAALARPERRRAQAMKARSCIAMGDHSANKHIIYLHCGGRFGSLGVWNNIKET